MGTNFFLNMFPPPNYLRMPAVGFDISDRSVKYIELQKDGCSIRINRFGERAVPEGLIDAGVIKQKGAITDFLKTIQKELKSKFIIAALPEEKVFVSRAKLPQMEKRQIREAIELQLEEHIPLSPKEAVFDFDIINNAPGAEVLDLSLVAFSRSLVEDYRDIFIGAGFMPVVFEMEAHAFSRAIIPKNETGTVMVIDFGKTRTTFAIGNKTNILFTSTIKVAGKDLEESIMKNLNVDQFQAVKIKKERGFVRSRSNEKVFNAILPVVSVIKDESSKNIAYWDSHLAEHGAGSAKISKIFLCGGDSNLFGLTEYLSYELKLPVKLGNPWVNLISFEEYIPQIELRASLAYATAIGLALRSFGQQ